MVDNNFLKKETSSTNDERYLCFSLGEEFYAIPLLTVKEVIAMPQVTPVPFTQPHFIGITNLRGQVISIIDLRQKLGIKAKNSSEMVVIICDLKDLCLGIVVDSIESVLAPNASEISNKPDIMSSRNTDYITGVFKKEDHLILFLNLEKSLSIEEQKTIASQNKK